MRAKWPESRWCEHGLTCACAVHPGRSDQQVRTLFVFERGVKGGRCSARPPKAQASVTTPANLRRVGGQQARNRPTGDRGRGRIRGAGEHRRPSRCVLGPRGAAIRVGPVRHTWLSARARATGTTRNLAASSRTDGHGGDAGGLRSAVLLRRTH